jgi:hypothetical protein
MAEFCSECGKNFKVTHYRLLAPIAGLWMTVLVIGAVLS